MMNRIFVLLGVLVLSLHARAEASSHAADIERMLQLAREAKLAQRAEWLKINLYHPSFGGVTSRVDDPSYFLSAEGKHDPAAELEATIRGAFDDSLAVNSRQPNVCRWIARYQFLSRSMHELGFSYQPVHCAGFENWKSGIAIHRATLVFASVYLNSPASMYGHAFIRFDSAKPGSHNRLNDATVGYSVQASDGMGTLFLLRSLLGGYPGSFTFVPYFMKVREYADLENRDLWEYQTDLQREEIERMLAFIWEQSFTYMNYYFFDDNCALMLLASFEAARPELDLVGQAKPWFIPLDVVKLVQHSGLVAQVHYRPSQYHTLLRNYDLATPAEQAQALALVADAQATLPVGTSDSEQARISDLTLGILEYQRNQQQGQREAAPIEARQISLSGLRSKLDVETRYLDKEAPAERPDQGHDSMRSGLVWGQIDGHAYTQFNLRGGYHDSLDPQSGFAQGASSKIGDLYLRLNAGRIRFERLDLFDVFAPSVQSEWFKPQTIKFNVSIRRDALRNETLRPTVFRIQAAAGQTYRVDEDAIAYVMADSVTGLRAGSSSLQLGPTAGGLWAIAPKWRAEAASSVYWTALGDERHATTYRLTASLAWDLFNNQNNLRLNVARQVTAHGADMLQDYTDLQLAYFHYF
ncbi:MAG: DUF4105 domain-containing protein [Pseudomonadota bacterium]